MRTAGSNRLRGELAGNELRTRKEYVSDRDAGFKQPLERCKLLTRWAFEYFDQTSNWAYMVMASLAWNLKAWFGLSLPEKGRWASKYKIEKRAVIEMEFKTFVNAFIRVPAQIIRQGRKTIYRLLTWNPWQPVFRRGFDQFTTRMQC